MEHLVKTGESINSYSYKLQPGDTVIVEPGEQGKIAVQVSGVKYKSLEPLKAKTDEWFFHDKVSQVVIDMFEMTGNGPLMESSNAYNLVKNCYIHDAGMGWDITQGGDYNILEHCIFERCYYAMHTSGSSNHGNIFRYNKVYDSKDDGVNVSPSALGTQILFNIIANSGDDGIHLFDDGKAIVRGNLVYGSGGVGLWTAGGGGIVTENNTVIGKSGTVYKKLFWLERSGHRVRNNIFYVNDPKELLFFSEGSGDIDYNCWYNPQNPMSPIGTHGIALDPKLDSNYKLLASSPCIGAGENGVNMGYWKNGGGKEMWDITRVDFVATFKKGSITGKVTKDGLGLEGVSVDVTGEVTTSVLTDSEGIYQVPDLPNGVYKVTPKSGIYDFNPTNIDISIPSA